MQASKGWFVEQWLVKTNGQTVVRFGKQDERVVGYSIEFLGDGSEARVRHAKLDGVLSPLEAAERYDLGKVEFGEGKITPSF